MILAFLCVPMQLSLNKRIKSPSGVTQTSKRQFLPSPIILARFDYICLWTATVKPLAYLAHVIIRKVYCCGCFCYKGKNTLTPSHGNCYTVKVLYFMERCWIYESQQPRTSLQRNTFPDITCKWFENSDILVLYVLMYFGEQQANAAKRIIANQSGALIACF